MHSDRKTTADPSSMQDVSDMNLVSSVDIAANQCLGGHGFNSHWGLGIFLCTTFATCRIFHLSHFMIPALKIYHLSFFNLDQVVNVKNKPT